MFDIDTLPLATEDDVRKQFTGISQFHYGKERFEVSRKTKIHFPSHSTFKRHYGKTFANVIAGVDSNSEIATIAEVREFASSMSATAYNYARIEQSLKTKKLYPALTEFVKHYGSSYNQLVLELVSHTDKPLAKLADVIVFATGMSPKMYDSVRVLQMELTGRYYPYACKFQYYYKDLYENLVPGVKFENDEMEVVPG